VGFIGECERGVKRRKGDVLPASHWKGIKKKCRGANYKALKGRPHHSKKKGKKKKDIKDVRDKRYYKKQRVRKGRNRTQVFGGVSSGGGIKGVSLM